MSHFGRSFAASSLLSQDGEKKEVLSARSCEHACIPHAPTLFLTQPPFSRLTTRTDRCSCNCAERKNSLLSCENKHDHIVFPYPHQRKGQCRTTYSSPIANLYACFRGRVRSSLTRQISS
ncbi:hypothetical protein VTL71DRAFT_1566 [Oculimacula yallundae]|uniref:Uncharacterized protein n=1 Tax=Oculimacula yallundae TaxID=86028 RepID=A0ABR4CC86_9HELO